MLLFLLLFSVLVVFLAILLAADDDDNAFIVAFLFASVVVAFVVLETFPPVAPPSTPWVAVAVSVGHPSGGMGDDRSVVDFRPFSAT